MDLKEFNRRLDILIVEQLNRKSKTQSSVDAKKQIVNLKNKENKNEKAGN